MIFNEHLDRLMEVQIVQDFMQQHRMQGKLCSQGDNHSFILYRLPYVVEFYDNFIEDYLEIYFSDMNSGLRMHGNSALGCSLDMALQDLSELRQRDFENHPQNDIFISYNARKMGDLDSNLEALSKLLPLIEFKGGLASMRDGTFDNRFDFSTSVQSIWPSLKEKKEKYLQCINSK